MELVKYEMEVPKEGKEVVDLLDAILAKVMAKAPIAEYADVLTQLVGAVDGVQNLPAELASNNRDELAGYLVHKLLGTLLPVKAATEV